jgi:MFS family permease
MIDPIAWCALRGFTGLCFAVLYMVVESWLNEQSSNENRGQVLSVYIIITNMVTMAGQLMVNLYDPAGPLLFSLVAILVCLSLVPLSLTQTAQPAPVPVARVRIGQLFGLSPSGVAGCLVIGSIEGAFWTLGPVFAQGRGLEVAEVTIFMSAFVLGGTISQWPLGRLSDRIDRRKVIVGCCLGTVCTGLALAFLDLGDGAATFAIAVLHGAFMVPLYALCLAHANDYAPTEALVETSSSLLLVYAVGAILGPLAVAPLMDAFGLGSLFLFMAVVLGALALFALIRMTVRPIAAEEDRVEFVPMPKTTPSVYSLEQDD